MTPSDNVETQLEGQPDQTAPIASSNGSQQEGCSKRAQLKELHASSFRTYEMLPLFAANCKLTETDIDVLNASSEALCKLSAIISREYNVMLAARD